MVPGMFCSADYSRLVTSADVNDKHVAQRLRSDAFIELLLAAARSLCPLIRRFLSMGLNRVWLKAGHTAYQYAILLILMSVLCASVLEQPSNGAGHQAHCVATGCCMMPQCSLLCNDVPMCRILDAHEIMLVGKGRGLPLCLWSSVGV